MRLFEANAAAHEVLEGLLMEVLGAAVDGEIGRARAHMAQLREAFETHLAVEEARTLPLLRDLGGPLVKLAVIIDGDHRIVDRSLNAVSALLEDVGDDGPAARAAVLGKIEVFSKLKTVLEHHGVREQEDVYTPLDHRFPELEWTEELLLPKP
ncbi:MAG: hemerythrin domain-containing protein [Deltaproteobacteria bacterium]|nr:hemerythrin domain-containing protein [Deltaproteobacteria bacterium]